MADDQVVSIGVDLGGTKIEAAVLRRPRFLGGSSAPPAADGDFEVLFRERIATNRDRGYDAVLDATSALILEVAERTGLDIAHTAVGVGMPGAFTRRTGLVKNSNTVCLNGRPFRADLIRRIGRDIAFANDANCFALAEARLGAARPYVDGVVFGVIIGSGVGGGIVQGGKVWPGLQNIAGEWGHHAVGPLGGESATARLGTRAACYCGNVGCLEQYLSGPAVEAEYARRTGTRRGLAEIASLGEHDAAARAALDELVEAFGRGLANVIDILDPSAVVLGGGVSNLDLLYTEGRASVTRYVFNDELETPILKHMLGDSAGVLGAALLDGN